MVQAKVLASGFAHLHTLFPISCFVSWFFSSYILTPSNESTNIASILQISIQFSMSKWILQKNITFSSKKNPFLRKKFFPLWSLKYTVNESADRECVRPPHKAVQSSTNERTCVIAKENISIKLHPQFHFSQAKIGILIMPHATQLPIYAPLYLYSLWG